MYSTRLHSCAAHNPRAKKGVAQRSPIETKRCRYKPPLKCMSGLTTGIAKLRFAAKLVAAAMFSLVDKISIKVFCTWLAGQDTCWVFISSTVASDI